MIEQQMKCNAPPSTPGQWLPRSVGWTFGCSISAGLLNKAVSDLWHYLEIQGSSVPMLVMLGSGYASVFLIWWQVLRGSSAVLLHDPQQGAFFWARLIMVLWRVVLVLTQVYQLGCLLFVSGMVLWDMLDHEPIGDYF